MKILSNLVNLIFGKNLKLEAQSVNKNNLEKMIAKSYELIESMNQLLKEANTSESIHTREENLLNIKLQLEELKGICSKYPAIYITELESFERSIKGVEAETLGMKIATEIQPKNLDVTKLGDNDKNTILECIYSQFKVINESIEIARKSKSLDTTKSRLTVASNILNIARKEAKKYSLDFDGFDEAEAEIARITEAVKTGAPKIFEGMRNIEPDPMYSTPSRNLLKEATGLKKEKRYVEACDKLRDAYNTDGADVLMIEERLRLPMYLQLAGKNDEGWVELNKLLKKYNDQFSVETIHNQMKVFLKKEKNIDATNPVRIIEYVDIKNTLNQSAADGLLSTEQNLILSNKIEVIARMSLSKQCEEMSLAIHDITLAYEGKPEIALLNHFQSFGYTGSTHEGVAMQTVIKALMLDKLAEYNIFNDRSDSCVRLIEAQLIILKDKASELISTISKTNKKTFMKNFQEIINQPFVKHQYPDLSLEFAESIFDAIETDIFIRLATKLAEDPYSLRSGWPDLTLVKGNDIRFIEVKTNDKLHNSQISTIPILREILPFEFSVYKVRKLKLIS